MAKECEGRTKSSAGWITIYNRSCDLHEQIELATDVRHPLNNSTTALLLSFMRSVFKSTDTNRNQPFDASRSPLLDLFRQMINELSSDTTSIDTSITMQKDPLPNGVDMISNMPDSYGTQPSICAKFMTGRTKNNPDATVSDKSASFIPEEALKAFGRNLTKDGDNTDFAGEKLVLELLMNNMFGMFFTLFSNSVTGYIVDTARICVRQGFSDIEELHRASLGMDTEKMNASAGMRTETEIPERLKTVAEEIAKVLNFIKDADDSALMIIRNNAMCDQRYARLSELMGIPPNDSSFMEINVDQTRGCSDNDQTNTEMPTTSTLSKLIRGHLSKRRMLDDNQNAKSASENNAHSASESNASQHTEDAHEMLESFSLATRVGMTFIGYEPNLRKVRINRYREFNRRFTGIGIGCLSILIAGSKSEGLTRFFESDFDFICVVNSVICIEDKNHASDIHKHTTVLIMDTDEVCPGYCRLLLERKTVPSPSIVMSINKALWEDRTGRLFVSSDLFFSASTELVSEGFDIHARAGPSFPQCFHNVFFDHVVALRCHCPGILNKWAERPRHWPPPDVVQRIVSLEAFATPVGFKGSKSDHLEWRICFNPAETELIISLNDTQTELYVLLKMVVKDILRPRRKEITSFTVKNIVLWLAEKNQQILFHDRKLLHWLHKSLEELRTAIATQNLAYYMIPERNLMSACGLESEQQRAWVETLTDMLNEGPMVILRFKQILQAFNSKPDQLIWYSKIRTECEMLLFVFIQDSLQCWQSKFYDKEGDIDWETLDSKFLIELVDILIRLKEIIEEVHKRLNMDGIEFYDTYDILVRMMS